MTFPSAVAFYIGSWPVRWYGVLYGLGVAASMMYSQKCVRQGYFPNLYEEHLEGFINYAVISIVIGARLGHFLLYDYRMMTQNPVRLLYVWEGGLSFHGGMFGFLVYETKKHTKPSGIFGFCRCLQISTRQIRTGGTHCASTKISQNLRKTKIPLHFAFFCFIKQINYNKYHWVL